MDKRKFDGWVKITQRFIVDEWIKIQELFKTSKVENLKEK